MESASIFIQTKAYKDGTVPIFLRFIVSAKVSLKSICKVYEYQIDRKNKRIRSKHPEYIMLNELLDKELAGAKRYITTCKLKGLEVNPDLFFNRLQGDTIADLIRSRANEFREAGSYGTYKKYRAVANKIERSGLNKPLYQINRSWVAEYDAYLKSIKNKPNTRRANMTVISPTLNNIEGQYNPLIGYKKPSNKGSKEKLSIEEVELFKSVKLEGFEHIARLSWLFSFYGRGIRVFDLLTMRWSNIVSGRLVWIADKGKKDKDVLIRPEMQAILDELPRTSEYVFPIVREPYTLYSEGSIKDREYYKERVNHYADHVNKALQSAAIKAGITKHITNHVSRHSFSYQGIKNAKLDLVTMQNLLDHGSMITTKNYAEALMSRDEMDEAAGKVG